MTISMDNVIFLFCFWHVYALVHTQAEGRAQERHKELQQGKFTMIILTLILRN